MNDLRVEEFLRRLNKMADDYLADQNRRSSQAQIQFLQNQQGSLRQLGELMQLQGGLVGARPQGIAEKPILFDRAMLEEFAAGSVERCLGPEYAIFRGKRIPRIPNGALLLMDRVLDIRGARGQLNQPSEIITEYQVLEDAWYFTDGVSTAVPYAVLMEMALQPCGFLSAYLGTMLISPANNLYFRNLDGEARLLRQVDLRGQIVTGWACMTGHTVNQETVIQRFDFHLAVGGQVFYEGSSVFGFFPAETMARQVGLDGGKESTPLYRQLSSAGLEGRLLDLRLPGAAVPQKNALRLGSGKLALLDEVYFEPMGGAFGKGYIFASRQVRPQDWFFQNHFFQDPVMPGSLGVEAVLEALRAFAIAQGYGSADAQPSFELVEGLPFYWKYRGQILPTTKEMLLEVQVRRIDETPRSVEIEGEANLWAGPIRIYQFNNAAMRIAKG